MATPRAIDDIYIFFNKKHKLNSFISVRKYIHVMQHAYYMKAVTCEYICDHTTVTVFSWLASPPSPTNNLETCMVNLPIQ